MCQCLALGIVAVVLPPHPHKKASLGVESICQARLLLGVSLQALVSPGHPQHTVSRRTLLILKGQPAIHPAQIPVLGLGAVRGMPRGVHIHPVPSPVPPYPPSCFESNPWLTQKSEWQATQSVLVSSPPHPPGLGPAPVVVGVGRGVMVGRAQVPYTGYSDGRGEGKAGSAILGSREAKPGEPRTGNQNGSKSWRSQEAVFSH